MKYKRHKWMSSLAGFRCTNSGCFARDNHSATSTCPVPRELMYKPGLPAKPHAPEPCGKEMG